jgi:type II secretory ATPase GspE/PulE/Tfp pilus assembly ATPase PilB-like protein
VSQEELTGKLDFAVSRIYQDGNLITRIETEEIKLELPSGKAESIVYYIARIEFEKESEQVI